MNKLMPRQPVPELKVPTLNGTTWRLADVKSERFTLVVFYRGLHCPVCRTYLGELDKMAADFKTRGVEIFTLSSDTEERAKQAQKDWGLANLNIGYGLDLDVARQWDLYVSTGRGKTSSGFEEPAKFSEPGVFLVRADGTLYWASVQTMPFARPHFKDMLGAIDFVIKVDYPARGEA